jgi:hypothetical protein
MADNGAHHPCWLLLQALFMTASVLTTRSTTATRTIIKGVFIATLLGLRSLPAVEVSPLKMNQDERAGRG